MIMAVALLLIVAASVLFHVVNPWWTTPLASNWRQMDDTLTITLVITGLFFVVINVFIAYTLVRFRHREGHRAAHEPESRKLERWLIGGTTVGIMALLAPGLVVYANYVKEPRDALVLEVLAQQWQWRFRFPGADGKLGATDARFVSAANPFGIDPGDPAGQDDLLVAGNEVHLPLGTPVLVLMRSNDVLHDFFVPPFRARMNIVPGQVSRFWFTPTVAGNYEALCAQLCGVGHPNMRGFVVVEDPASYRAWQAALPTFASSQARAPELPPDAAAAGGGARVQQGRALADAKGCVACHTVDGSARVGPTWKGLYGKTETMSDGSTALVDDAYLRSFIQDPQARQVKGFPPVMPRIELSDEELAALVAYIQSLGSPPAQAAPEQKAAR
ncbi:MULTISPECIES: cytochrome c oxidase subunit II [unclassified Variovorax]|jgi:cytochrome c oxidase subunit 2|uniref:cytochrome c oxidase subunit II n=1 Tax=unclassified Variovorax TaxID=663243 RepID=UPI000F7E8AFC|nr:MULTISPECIES: cytochrome c oxidase subunit II [unclassified Variovorax]RSZ38411.1 c-type cytochrome [Variovorax sp. 553]RSZ39137.1 c-type cytochrome [Variovorax sp. 679]